MENSKVTIVSNVNGPVGVYLPQIQFRREWAKRGQKYTVDKTVLENMMYDNGARYMLETGMLYIEDMEVKKEVGLEPEDATEPTHIIVLNEKQKEEALTIMPTWKFKELIGKLSGEEINNLVDYAISKEIVPGLDKCDIIKGVMVEILFVPFN